MKLIIAGGRDYKLTEADYMRLDELWRQAEIEEVVSGGASGADRCGEQWAGQHNIPVKRFVPQWEAFGKAAGPMRNRAMAGYADAVALFPGGRGTESMYNEAKKAGIEIY